MLHKSSLFLEILKSYMIDENQSNAAMYFITKAETELIKRKPLDQITVSTLSEDIDRALRYVESQNHIIQTVSQLRISILKNKLELEKKLLATEQLENARMEFNPEIIAIKTKTEQQKAKKEAAKKASQETRDELDITKIEVNAIDIFVTNATNNRELAMSYYQAVKGITPKHN
ncbi:MAG: hypothetical protein ACRC0G_09665 [Fusobacteriaceae bacterium]